MSGEVALVFPDIPPDLDEIPSGKMSIYLGMELFRVFKASDNKHSLTFSLVVVLLGILGNMILILLSVACSSIRSKTFAIESFRALAEIALLVTSILLLHFDQYNVNDTNSEIVGAFVVFWLSAVSSALLGLLQSVRCFMCFTSKTDDGQMTSWTIPRFVISLFVTGALTVVSAVVTGVIYVANILAFMVLGCMLYFVPFVISFCLDMVKIGCLAYSAKKTGDPRVRYSVHTEDDHGQLRVDEGQQAAPSIVRRQDKITEVEVIAVLLAGGLHTLAFSVVTLALARIGTVFFSRADYIVLQSTIDIMALTGL